MSKKLINLLRHGNLLRDDAAIEIPFCAFSTLVWWKVEEHHDEKRTKQENISIFYWSIRTRNYSSPSSSRSFRTQFHWSFITGQCINSERFLRVNLSHRMCNQFTFHHKFQDWYLEARIWAKDRQYSFCLCEPQEQRTQRSCLSRLESTASCTIHA